MAGQLHSSATQTLEVTFDDGNVRVGLEVLDGSYYIHFDVCKWNKTSYNNLISAVWGAMKLVKQRGHSDVLAYFPKSNTIVPKICNVFSASCLGEADNYLIYVKEL